MSQHCTVNQKAIVTLADGRIFEYTENLPIDITCTPEYDDCQQVTVSYTWVRRNNSTGALTSTNAAVSRKAQIGGLRITADQLNIEILSRGGLGGTCGTQAWENILSLSVFANAKIISATITDIQTPVRRRLIIKNSLGVTLFNEVVPTCGYTIDCQEKCPPNSLDCGNCCLDCASILQQLKNARSQLLAITNNV